MAMAMQMAHILGGSAPALIQDFDAEISKSRYGRSAMAVMSLPSRKINYGVSFLSSCQLLRSSQHSSLPRKSEPRAISVTVRCEQSTEGSNSLDIWLGRIAMISFAAAITVEITTGKGLLQNFGLTSPLPTAALALTVLVGVLTAFFIFQSASKD
eukprot:Gb_32155 [translate_table: standard]